MPGETPQAPTPPQGDTSAKPVTFGQLTEENAPTPPPEPVKAKKAAVQDDDLVEEEVSEEESLDDEADDTEEVEEDADEDSAEDADTEEEEAPEEDLIDEETGEVKHEKLVEAISKLSPKELDKALAGVTTEVKVDGKFEKVTLGDLKESYSSRAHNARWAQQNKAKEAEVISKMGEVERTIGPVWSDLKEDKLEGAFLKLAGLKGKNILDVKRQLRQELAPVIIGLAKMTPEQQKVWLTQEENEFYKSQQESTKKQTAEARTQNEGVEAVARMQRQHGISDSEMESAIDWLLEKKLGGDQSKLNLDMVLETVTISRTIDRALEAISISRPSLKSDPDFVDRVVRLAKSNPKAPISRLAKWVREHAPSSKDKDASELAKDISRKVLKTKPKSSLEKPSKQKPKSFSDLP